MHIGQASYKTYLVYMKADVTGLSEDSPVRYNGVKVGYVSSIQLDKRNLRRVRIKLKISDDTPINTSTVASAMPQGITGILYISLQSTKTQAPNLQVGPGEKYPVIPSKPSLFTQIGKDIPKLVNKTSDLIDNMQMAFSKSNRKKFTDALDSIHRFAQVLAKNSDKMSQVVTKVDKTLTNINQASQDAPETMKSIRRSARSVENAGEAANEMMAKGEKTVEFINQHQLPELQQLTNKLNRSATTLDQLLKQLNDNPSMLIRGKQSTPPGPGE